MSFHSGIKTISGCFDPKCSTCFELSRCQTISTCYTFVRRPYLCQKFCLHSKHPCRNSYESLSTREPFCFWTLSCILRHDSKLTIWVFFLDCELTQKQLRYRSTGCSLSAALCSFHFIHRSLRSLSVYCPPSWLSYPVPVRGDTISPPNLN